MTAVLLLLSFTVATCVGLLLTSLLWPTPTPTPALMLFKFCLAVGLGHGVTSGLLFCWLMVWGEGHPAVAALELVLAACALSCRQWLARRAGRRGRPVRRVLTPRRLEPWGRLLAAGFVAALLSAGLATVSAATRSPSGGGWDAWAIYGLRARTIYRAGMDWRDAFSPLIPWTHPDYPPLLPLTVVRAWLYAGGESAAAQAALSPLFTFAALGLTCSALALLRGAPQALLAGTVMLGHTFFITHAASGYADPPLMFFVSATTVLLSMRGLPGRNGAGLTVLAGLAAGLAAWTKNEGLLFALAATVALVAARSHGGARARLNQLLLFAVGIAPALACVLAFKALLAPPSYLSAGSAAAAAKLSDPGRYALILRGFTSHFASHSGRSINLTYLLIIFLVCTGLTRGWWRSVRPGVTAVCLMVAGYFLVYLITPYDLAWHIQFSLDRLLLNLWPACVFLLFLAAASPESFPTEESPAQLDAPGGRTTTQTP